MLSVCIPAYIHAKFTLESVKCMLAGSEDFELVVVDDFYRLTADSEEARSAEELLDLLDEDPRARSHRNTEQIPIYRNWNQTVSHASRPFVKLIGADDRLVPTDLKRLLEIVQNSPEVSVHGHLARVIDSQGNVTRIHAPYLRSQIGPVRVEGKHALKLKLAQVARLREPACNVFSKSAWAAVGGYPEDVRFRSDVTFNTRLLRHGIGYLWSEHLAELRRHPGSDGRTLPADLAARELGDLIDELYAALGSDLNTADRRHGESWHLYRLIELVGQRYKTSPIEAMRFMLRNRRSGIASPFVWLDAFTIVYRRLMTGDVQKTFKKESEFEC